MFLITFSGSALADLATTQFVESFNNMNGLDSLGYPQGYLFTRQISSDFYGGSNSGEIRLVNNPDADPSLGRTPKLSAYSDLTANDGTGTNFYFQTFVVAPEQTKMQEYEYLNSQLHYRTNPSQTNTDGYSNPLTLGVAYLYKEFAAGKLGKGTDYEYHYETGRADSAVQLQDAIWFLMSSGLSTDIRDQYFNEYMVNSSTDWGNNIFLEYLLTLPISKGNPDFWLAVYDPAGNYGDLMGNAKVFVMNVYGPRTRSFGPDRQDVLFVTLDGGSDVPEPATFLLWTLGSLGAAGVAYRKRRKTF